MEQEKMKKRARERDDETEIHSYENNKKVAKKRDMYGINLMKKKEKEKEIIEADQKGSSETWDSSSSSSSSSHISSSLGVFDFPWLKDGISQTEDLLLDFEDKFSSSLQYEDAAFNAAGFDFSEAFMSFCETPKTSTMVDCLWKPLEIDGLEIKAEDVDSIWSSLFKNNPL